MISLFLCLCVCVHVLVQLTKKREKQGCPTDFQEDKEKSHHLGYLAPRMSF